MRPKDVRFHFWALAFVQSSSRPLDQTLQGHNLHDFCCSSHSSQALVPPFQVQGSRGRLGGISPELRPPPVAIVMVRTTAHSFLASGSSVSSAQFLKYDNKRAGDSDGDP
jgi:hypothetical protein